MCAVKLSYSPATCPNYNIVSILKIEDVQFKKLCDFRNKYINTKDLFASSRDLILLLYFIKQLITDFVSTFHRENNVNIIKCQHFRKLT